MTALRRFLSHRRWLAVSIIAAALLVRVLVPAGYMAARTDDGIKLELCSGVAGSPVVAAMPGMHHGGDKPEGHAQPEMPCAFGVLAAPSLGAADPLSLAAAIAFIVAAIFRPMAVRRATAPPYLRPPLRGPPPIA